MDLIFCGTPEFAVPTLKKLVEAGHDVRLVVTQPDRPSGRGQEFAAPPVKRLAESLGLPLVQPEKIKNNLEFRAQLEALKPEAIIVVGYGRIIPKWMIDLPRHGNINLHASLLPKYRGAAPIQWAIARGETVTGVTTMRIDEGLDTGDILLQCETPIDPEDTAVTLSPRLAEMGAELMLETLRGLETGTVQPRKQDHTEATLAPILEKDKGQIDFNHEAPEILNRLRGFQPWPGAFTTFRGKNLTLHRARLVAYGLGPLLPGEVKVAGEDLFLGCGEGTALEMLELQPEGKRRMSARDFIHGYRPKAGERLGSAEYRVPSAE
ncbi:MAG TPA: methionyl-tRNA formyltransferase [Terriglobales bacterium]|jgi:methionyl-tRNA formyltransferase|nr:methionyl-tRNA formyltransferase [Terriglobales bacterium]